MLLHELSERPGEAEMLDIGIGAGRTSVFFAPIVRRYVGVDIAEGMVQACRERFRQQKFRGNVEFRVADAAKLEGFADNSFDVVLFSFNGLDCLDASLRDACLLSIRRVLRNGGRFLFSAHNLRVIDTHYRRVPHKHPRKFLAESDRLRRNLRNNGELAPLLALDQAPFWDGVYYDHPEFKHVYIKPEHQAQELNRLGFANVEIISKSDGHRMAADEASTTRDSWVYFSSVAKK
jgi:SAM-dependent methyltransferase